MGALTRDSGTSEVWILSAVRTPIGRFQGALAEVAAPKLGATVLQSALSRAGVEPTKVQEVIMGEVLTAGVGQAPARQAALGASIPSSVPCLTINKVCGSGLKAVMLASDAIRLGDHRLALAGGQENMSLAPHLFAKSRTGLRMGHSSLLDSMVHDGLWDPYNDWHMGNAGELCAREKQFSRAEQDQWAEESYRKAQRAQAEGFFRDEIASVSLVSKKGTIAFDSDEEPSKVDFEKMATLKPAFQSDGGTITAANASKLNDGAAAVLLASRNAATELGKKPIARVLAHDTFAQDPQWFTTAPVQSIQNVLKKAGLSVADIDLFEINEAFAVVPMAAERELKIPRSKINVNGGAIALGHPIGASGARLLVTAVHALRKRNQRYGLVSLCVGGGEAVSLIVEAMP